MLLTFNKIKTKLFTSFGIFLFFSLIIGAVTFYYFIQIYHHLELRNQLDKLTILILEARKHEKDFVINEPYNGNFMKSGESTKIEDFNHTQLKIDSLLETLQSNDIIINLDLKDRVKEIISTKDIYKESFNVLTEKIRTRGFKDDGLEGEMRKIVHRLENDSAHVIEKSLLLTLRRHEKDFFLRKDEKYVEKLKKATEEILARSQGKAEIHLILNTYLAKFENIVSIEKEIGLDESKGIRGKLQSNFAEIEPKVKYIHNTISEFTAKMITTSIWIICCICVLFIFTSLFLAYYFSLTISAPIVILDRISRSVKKGLKSQEKFLDKINSKDEIGSLAVNFQIMLVELKKKLKQIEEQNQQLLLVSEEEKRQKWSVDGLAALAELLSQQDSTMEDKCYTVISFTVQYLKANQGALFLLNDDNKEEVFLELKASYAYDKRKYLDKKISKGEGLIGQTFLEEEYTYLTDIPSNYIKITSGLGYATPTSLIILPLKTTEGVIGIMEIASFQKLEKFEIAFLEKLSEVIGASLLTTRTNYKTARLLLESQTLTEELRAQEEEIRQNMEELLATQEQSYRAQEELKEKENEMLDQITNLSVEKSMLELKNKELNAQLELAKAQMEASSEIMNKLHSMIINNKSPVEDVEMKS